MSDLDSEALLAPLDTDAPCGPCREDEAAFLALEDKLLGTPERQMGAVLEPARPPNWREVRTDALKLLQATRDLRVQLALTRALTHLEGLPGLRDGLTLLTGTLRRYWDEVHPQLDPDDGNDPTLRVNILRGLTDHDSLLQPLCRAPLLFAAGLGGHSLRDLRMAAGRQAAPEGEPVADTEQIHAVAQAMDAALLCAQHQAAQDCLALLGDLDAALSERVGLGRGPDFEPLQAVLREMAQTLAGYVEERGLTGDAPFVEPGPENPAMPAQPQPAAPSGPIGNRDDVLRVLDQICDYYARQEPSSPVPLLLKRARGLVKKDFLDIMRDLAADSLERIELITGKAPPNP